jgi:hypothetical protein
MVGKMLFGTTNGLWEGLKSIDNSQEEDQEIYV